MGGGRRKYFGVGATTAFGKDCGEVLEKKNCFSWLILIIISCK